jgi:sulfite exporter TauE/SafE
MLAFGAGTLPAVVLVSAAAGRVTGLAAGSVLRRIAGVLIMLSGVVMAVAAAGMRAHAG